MDRRKKLYLICGAAMILLVFIVTALILSAQKRNATEPELEPTPPIETLAPVITPGSPASPTEAEETASPTTKPTQAPELPDANITESTEPTATPTTSVTPKPTVKPTTTAKPTAVPNVELPSGTSNTNTHAAATPKPSEISKAAVAAVFDFSLPVRASEKASVTVTTNSANVESVAWKVSKKGFLGIQTDAGSEVTGTLNKSGGTLAFLSAGTYTVTATVKTADNKSTTVSHEIEIRSSDSFNFSMPLTAYADTVVHVSVPSGTEAAAWAVTKESSAIQQESAFAGTLEKSGGYITFKKEGKYTLIGSSRTGKEVSATITVYALPKVGFKTEDTTYRNKEITVSLNDGAAPNAITWEVKKGGDKAEYKGTLGSTGGKLSFAQLGVYTITATAKDARTGRTFSATHAVSVVNQPPAMPQGKAIVTDTRQENKALVEFSASCIDPDGDETTIEWDGRTADDYYIAGAEYTVMVRARDSLGDYSSWTEVTFQVE